MHLSEEGDLVTALLAGLHFLSVSMSITVTVIVYRLFDIVINVRAFQHLREIDCHSIEDEPGLCVGINVFITSPGDDRGTIHQLRDH